VVFNSYKLNKNNNNFMKTKKILLVVLISLLAGLGQMVKADTIHIYLPVSSMYESCEDINDFNTFIVHKHPMMSGTPMWMVNGVPVSNGDSLIYTPAVVGLIDLSCMWNSITFGVLLNLFSTPPSHADFAMLAGGEINASHDTAWMCSPSLSLAAMGITDNDATSLEWTGPGFSVVNDNPVTITSPGKYYFTRVNPCGITVDSIQVVALPTTLPVWDDELFCNEAVNVVLDAGAGWEYTWSHGPSTQSVTLTEAGTYTVTATNVCTSISSGMSIEHQEYPLPNLFQYHVPWSHCGNEAIVMDLSEYTYDSYAWSVGGPILSTANTFTATVSDNYGVTVTQGSCIATDLVSIDFFLEPMVPEICIVTVDPTMTKNKIVWTAGVWEPFSGDPNYSPFVEYNVYKWAGGNSWTFLGSVPVADEHTFTDLSSNPAVSPERYKITALDECGVESQMSYYHQTITLLSSLGTTPGEVSLSWSEYKDESNVFLPGMYEIWRGTSPENLEYLASTPFTVYNDIGAWGQVYYQIVAVRPGGCDPAAQSKSSRETVTGSFSNITNNVVSKTVQQYTNSISIYPNPATTQINIITDQTINEITIYSITGQEMLKLNNTKTVDVSGLAAGSYSVKIVTDSGVAVERVVVE
jgi:hypothetical protein